MGTILAAKFLLELVGLVVIGTAAGTLAAATESVVLVVVASIGAPLLVAVLWALLLSPRARWRLSVPVRVIGETLAFGLAVAGLALLDQPGAAIAFGIVVMGVTVGLLATGAYRLEGPPRGGR